MLHKKEFIKGAVIPALILSIAAIIYISPVLDNIANIGVSDWDSQLFYHAAPLKTIVTYRQFPLWNPYFCGGAPMLASPEISFLSPFYVFVLAFGEVVGVKIIIVSFTLMGMWGMYLLARTLGMGRVSSYLPPVIFMMSSWYTLRISEGHSGFMPFALLPFAAAFYIRSLEGRGRAGYIILCAASLAWMIFAGGIYPFAGAVIFLSLFCAMTAISKRTVRAVVNLILIAVLAIFLSAVKTIPQYEFVSEFPRKTSAVQYHSGKILGDALFSRNQRVTAQEQSFYRGVEEGEEEYLKGFWGGARPWGWQEYGSFIGIGAFALYLAGFFFFRKIWVWLSISLITLFISLGEFAPVKIWSALRHLPVFGSLHGPSRFGILFVFTVSVIAGYALTRLEEGASTFRQRGFWAARASIAAVFLIFIEIITVSRPVLKDAFTEPPHRVVENKDFYHIIVEDPTSTNYVNFLKNTGVANCYESMHPPTSVSPYADEGGNINPGYTGEVYLAGGGGVAVLRSFTPNKVTVDVDVFEKDRLVLNQNYFKGWRVRSENGEIADGEAVPFNGLVSAEAEPGKARVSFYYSPRSFKIGLLITVLSAIASAAVLMFSRPSRNGKSS